MRIVWTCWKGAVSREWYHWIFLLVLVGIVLTLIDGWIDPSTVETDAHGLLAYVRHYPFLALVPFWLLMSVPLRLRREWSESAGKAFSYCLPGYRESLRAVYFLCALPVGLACCLLWMMTQFAVLDPDQSAGPAWQLVVLSALSSFLVGMAAFLAISVSRFVLTPLVWGLLALASFPLGLLGLVVWLGIDVHDTSIWIAVGLVSLIVIVFFWVRLGAMRYVARGHRAIIVDAMDRRTQADVKRTAPDWVDDAFLDWARRYPVLGRERYVWASLYQAFGRILSYWKWVLAVALAVSVTLALTPGFVAEAVFVFLGLMAPAFVDPPPTSNLLLPGGRRERYYATISTVVATSLLLLALAVAMAGVSEMVAIARGADVGDLGHRFRSAWLACVFVPWACAIRIAVKGLGWTERASSVVPFAILAPVVFVHFVDFFEWSVRMRLLFFAGMCFCGWVVFLLAAKYVCTRGALIEQKVWAGG